jgi:dihydrolipoamide dehydrogenase
VRGVGEFTGPNQLEVEVGDGGTDGLASSTASSPPARAATLPFIPDDPRVIDSTGALELAGVPERLLVIGGGIIGLEMATVYDALGSRSPSSS